MPRYIDAEKIEYKTISVPVLDGMIVRTKTIDGIYADQRDIKAIPTADVQEVVRCKDCKYLMFSDMYGECSHAILGIVSPDDYCSRGKKKGGGKK